MRHRFDGLWMRLSSDDSYPKIFPALVVKPRDSLAGGDNEMRAWEPRIRAQNEAIEPERVVRSVQRCRTISGLKEQGMQS
jgi:hypothetical protein